MTSNTGSDTVRIGIFSTAHLHSEAYAAELAELENAELIGVADEKSDRGQSFAASQEISYLPEEELLDLVDGAIVCSTNANHGRWVRQAAYAGVHVLAEKPLAPTTAEAQNIVETAERENIHLGVAMPLRFSEPVLRAKQRLDADELGSVQAIIGTNRGQMPGGWFVDSDESGGGAVMDHTVHIVDLVHWLTGERVSEVYAETGTKFHDIPVEDVNVLSMTLSDGTQFSLDGSWSRPDSWDFWGDATVSFIGTEATIEVDCFAQKLKHTDDTEEPGIQSVYWGTDPNNGLIEDFVDAVRTDRPPEISGEEGVAAVSVVEAAYESAEHGEPVEVEY